MANIADIKAQIRSILLSLGKTATDQEFRKAYYEIEGTSFNEVLKQLNINFYDLFLRIPDVAKIVYAHNQVFIQRVSTQATAHMENLTVNKYSKNYRGPKLVTKSGSIKGRPMTNPLSVKAPVYQPYPMYTIPQRRVVPFQQQQNRQYQKPVQNNFNMKVSVGNNSRNVQCYYKNNASTSSWSRPAVSSVITTTCNQAYFANISTTSTSNNFNSGASNMTLSNQVASSGMTSYNQTSNFANISNTSTRNDLSFEALSKTNEMPTTSSVDSDSGALTRTTRMVPSNDISSISSVAGSESTRLNDDFDEDDKTSFKSALDETLKTPQKTPTETPRIAPMASSSKPTLKHQVTSLLRSNRQEEDKNLSRLDALADKVVDKLENLKLDDTQKSNGTQFVNPMMVRQRLRSMRIFREALIEANVNQERSSQGTELLFDTKDIIELPEPIQNEEELFFFVKIIDITSPSKFVFQFSFEKLKDLSNKMNNFYNNLQDIDKHQVKNLINDNIVAVRQNNLWYRGQIKSFNNTEARIQLVDSMKTRPQKVSCKNIFHLHQKFTTESPKSAFGKLHGLKPIDGEWSMLSTAKLDSIQDKPLLATVKCIDNGVYSLSIINETRSFTRLCDIFIEEDLAAVELDDLATESVFRSLV